MIIRVIVFEFRQNKEGTFDDMLCYPTFKHWISMKAVLNFLAVGTVFPKIHVWILVTC